MNFSTNDLLQEPGTPALIESRRPLLLDDPASTWIVQSGELAVFVVNLDNGRPVGSRHYAFSALPGAALFGMDLAASSARVGYLASAVTDAQLAKVPIARLENAGRQAATTGQVATLLDAWIVEVSQGLTAAPHPAAALPLTAGQSVSAGEGQAIGPEGGILWANVAEGEACFCGIEPLTQAHGTPPVPLSPQTWLQAAGACTIFAVATDEVLTKDGAWQGLHAFHQAILDCQRLRIDALERGEAGVLKEEAEYERSLEQQTVDALAGVLDRRRRPAATPPSGEPLLAACRLVGAALGISIQGPTRSTSTEALGDPIARIARASRVRIRRVALVDGWWERESGPLVGRTVDHRPVALLPASRQRYDMVDPVSGTRTRVNRRVAGGLLPVGYEFYRSLPERALRSWDLISFSLHGSRPDVARLLLFGAAGGLLATLIPIAMGLIFGTIVPSGERGRLAAVAVVLVGAAIAAAFFQIAQSIAILRIESRIDASLQAAVWDRLLRLPMRFFRDYSAGDLANRAMGIDTIRQLVAGATVSTVLASVFSLFSFALLFYYDAGLALVAALLTMITLAVTALIGYLQLQYQRRLSTVRGQILGTVLQFIMGIAKLRVAGAESRAYAVWARAFAAQSRLTLSAQTAANALTVFNAAWPVVISMALFATIVYREEGAISTGAFLAFTAAFGQFLAAITAMGTAFSIILQAVPLYERVTPILRTLPEVDRAKADPGVLSGVIDIQQLSFRYRDDGPLVLDNLSLSVAPGEFVAIVGPSGAGKSTLFRLLLGFEAPERGTISYDHRDLAGLDAEAVRRQIGVVTQDSQVTPGTIYANIIGSADLSLDDAWEAARTAGLDEDIRRLPMGMLTYVSEGGATFSGGQKQRLTIARAIVRKPRILLFDEATSSLDNRTQAIVSQSLDRLQATRLVIAHRLSTVQHADRIVVIEDGKILQSGTYSDLVNAEGPFAGLAKRQLM
ncbi:MAG: NHLP bacteriocin export ABC transporter permease/ATPase subunit [Dehalococcoidia bacterium]